MWFYAPPKSDRPADEPLLDRSKKYLVLGSDEKIWLFVYESSGTIDGTTQYSWIAYSKIPDYLFLVQGPWPEKVVYEFLKKNSHKLDQDDKLDLLLFINKGGLEKFLEKERKEIKESVESW